MSVSKWAYEPEKCDGTPCPGDCDECDDKTFRKDVTDYLIDHMDEDDLEATEIEYGRTWGE